MLTRRMESRFTSWLMFCWLKIWYHLFESTWWNMLTTILWWELGRMIHSRKGASILWILQILILIWRWKMLDHSNQKNASSFCRRLVNIYRAVFWTVWGRIGWKKIRVVMVCQMNGSKLKTSNHWNQPVTLLIQTLLIHLRRCRLSKALAEPQLEALQRGKPKKSS